MAGVARPRVERVVPQRLDQILTFGRMGIMALAAIQPFTGLAQMDGQEVFIIRVVTVETNAGHLTGQKRNMFATMGKMAIQTGAFGRGIMRVPCLHSFLKVRVALITESARTLDQQAAEFPCVGQMAPGALPAHEGLVGAAGSRRRQIHVMALGTKFILGRGQQTLDRRPVGQMAGTAFPVFIGRMDKIGRSGGMAVTADVFPAGLQQPGLARLVRIMAGDAVPAQNGLVHRRQGQPLPRFVMAGAAQFTMGIGSQPRIIRAVWKVAAQAVLVLEGGVNDGRPAVRR